MRCTRRSRARGGGRSSGNSGDGAMVHGRRGWWALRAPGSSLSTAVCSDSSCGGSSHAGDEARRRRASGTAALALGSVRSDGKKGRTAEELTAVPQGWLVGSGMSCRRRIERRRALMAGDGTAMVAALQRVRNLVARWRGRGGRGGARRHSEGSRGRRWPRRYGGAAAAALGLEREREQKRGKSSGESERAVGAAWRRPGRRWGGQGGSRRWPSRVEVARAAVSWCPSSWQGGRRQGRGGGGGLGRWGARPGKWAPGRWPRWPSLSPIVFLYSCSVFFI